MPLGQEQGASVEQRVGRRRRALRRGRAQRGLGDGPRSGRAVPAACPHRGPERLEVRLASQAGGHRLESSGRVGQTPRRLVQAELVEGDLSMQHLDAGAPELVERLGVERAEQSQRRVERTGIALGGRCRQHAGRPARGLG